MFIQPQFPMERNIFRLADGTSKVQSIVIRNTFEGKTDQLPEDWHRKLVIAMAHDTVTIENERLLSNVVLNGDYGIDWQDFLQYPIAQANFQVEVTPFNATNSNCQTCEEMTQLNLVDDTTTDIWVEGTTNEFPDVLTDNDSICCNPFVITLVTYNTLYFTAVSISAAGVLTATVLDPVPDVTGVLIATYRVTCPDGSYDEANVYGNIEGTGTACPPITDIVFEQTGVSEATLSWDVDHPAVAECFHWQLFLTADLGTPIDSGSVAVGIFTKVLTGLTSGVSYTFSLVVDCFCDDTSLSVPLTEEFTLTGFASSACGRFSLVYLPYADPIPQSVSYMDCNGDIINLPLPFAQTTEICMLITPDTEIQIYFVASSSDITITYVSLC